MRAACLISGSSIDAAAEANIAQESTRVGACQLSNAGPIYIDTTRGIFACIEVLDQPAIRSRRLEVLP